jgi:HSP20 family protein
MMTWYISPSHRAVRRQNRIRKNNSTYEKLDRENVLAVNVNSDGDAFMISALVPGINAEDIDVEILNKTISIRGSFDDQKEHAESKVLVKELPFGRFSRVLTLPTKLDPSKATANLKDGVFTLRVPKAEEVKPRNIEISAE